MAEGSRPLAIGPELAKLKGVYPRPQEVLDAAAAGQREQAILARLWVSEGIPFAFKRCPGLYEELRGSLAKSLGLDAKQISMGGSGRLGYSLAPTKWGERYRKRSSDLDLFAVSGRLFERLREDFERWRDDYSHGVAEPRTNRQRYYWNENRKETPDRIERGFIDSMRVPNHQRYSVFLAMNRCLNEIRTELQKADEGPKPRKDLTLRCYKDWHSYELQMTVSLRAVVDRHVGRVGFGETGNATSGGHEPGVGRNRRSGSHLM